MKEKRRGRSDPARLLLSAVMLALSARRLNAPY